MTGVFCSWAFAGGSTRFGAARSPALALLLAGALACGAPRAAQPAHLAAWLRADPQRCLLQRDLAEGMEDMARRCAEAFIRENGYTAEPATQDTTRWVLEGSERGPWPGVLALRGGSLQPESTAVQCSVRQCVVLFRVLRDALRCTYRLVTMTQVFTRIRIEPGAIRNVRCGDRQV